MKPCAFLRFCFLILLVGTGCYGGWPVRVDGTKGLGERTQDLLVKVLLQLVQKEFAGCHLVLAASYRNSSTFAQVVRASKSARVVVEGATLPPTTNTSSRNLQRSRWEAGLWKEGQATCRGLILDFTDGDITIASRVAEWSGLWTQPETRVVCVGGREGVETLLLDPALRNTQQALYITSHNNIPNTPHVQVWRRCGYCDGGEAGVHLLGRWDVAEAAVPNHPSLFTDSPENYRGHQFRLVENNVFPYTDGRRVDDEPGSLVIHKDSLGTRIIQTMARSFNFTYVVHEPVDREWGNEVSDGVWDGIVGTLMREEGDLCLDLTVTPQRSKVVQFAGAYVDESAVIVSSKPRPLPEYLSLIRPFRC